MTGCRCRRCPSSKRPLDEASPPLQLARFAHLSRRTDSRGIPPVFSGETITRSQQQSCPGMILDRKLVRSAPGVRRTDYRGFGAPDLSPSCRDRLLVPWPSPASRRGTCAAGRKHSRDWLPGRHGSPAGTCQGGYSIRPCSPRPHSRRWLRRVFEGSRLGRLRRQYSSASMTVITRTVTAGSVGSGDRYFRFRSK
jgi:hypothetical protein